MITPCPPLMSPKSRPCRAVQPASPSPLCGPRSRIDQDFGPDPSRRPRRIGHAHIYLSLSGIPAPPSTPSLPASLNPLPANRPAAKVLRAGARADTATSLLPTPKFMQTNIELHRINRPYGLEKQRLSTFYTYSSRSSLPNTNSLHNGEYLA